MEEFLKNNSSQERRNQRVVRNGLKILSEQIRPFLNRSPIDENTVLSAIEQLEKQKKTLDLAG